MIPDRSTRPAGPGESRSSWEIPRSKRGRALATRGTFLFHLRPIRLSRRAVRWTHTFGLGGSALVLWGTLAFTGMLMLLVYQPVPQVAYDSILTLSSRVRFGPLVRGVHYWSANLLIVVILLHVTRVVMTGGYHRPRRLNWIIGVALLAGVLASAFTGYLLPWDQRAFWAVTISTSMLSYVPVAGEMLQHVVRGGAEIGSDTLLTFYTYHTTILPVLALGFMAFHFWRVRKAGGVVEPPAASEDDEAGKVHFLPDLLLREGSQAMVVLAVVILLGALAGAPMGERANPGMSPNPAKAPWYFMGFQELLIHLHPIFAVLILPVTALAGFVALPWLGTDDGPSGRWFLSASARRAAIFSAVAAVVVSATGIVLDEAATSGGSGWFLRGMIQTLLLAGVAATVTAVSARRFRLNRNESLQTLVVFLAMVFVTLTVVGVFFRGEGMALTVPWGG
jgi:quinol-cytochrome oxidoreductase complex cytochrome b subunit